MTGITEVLAWTSLAVPERPPKLIRRKNTVRTLSQVNGVVDQLLRAPMMSLRPFIAPEETETKY